MSAAANDAQAKRLCRFLLFPGHKKETTFEVESDTTLSQLKARLVASFRGPEVNLRHWSQLRLIRAGTEILTDEQLTASLDQSTNSNSHSALTVHCVVKPLAASPIAIPSPSDMARGRNIDAWADGLPSSPGSPMAESPDAGLSDRRFTAGRHPLEVQEVPTGNDVGAALAQAIAQLPAATHGFDTSHGEEQPEGMSESESSDMSMSEMSEGEAQEYFSQWAASAHFHGAFFDEDEADLVGQAFAKHAREEGRGADAQAISYGSVHKFVWTFFCWTQKQKLRPADQQFPNLFFRKLVRRVLRLPRGSKLDKHETPVTLPQLREIFFLFDNETPHEETCEHGANARVRAAAQNLHNELCGESVPFSNEIFEQAFARSDADKSGHLSCQGVELCYFLYCVGITEQHPEFADERREREKHRPTSPGSMQPSDEL